MMPYTGRSWSIPIPPNVTLMTLNDRLTVAARIRRTHELRDLGGWLAIKHKMPREARALRCAHVLGFILVTDNRRYDPGNWMPTAKALVDGLVEAKVFADDDRSRVLGPDLRVRPQQRSKGFLLYIKEMTHMPEDFPGG